MQDIRNVNAAALHACRCGKPTQQPWGDNCSQQCTRAEAIELMLEFADEATRSANECIGKDFVMESVALSRMWANVAQVLQ